MIALTLSTAEPTHPTPNPVRRSGQHPAGTFRPALALLTVLSVALGVLLLPAAALAGQQPPHEGHAEGQEAAGSQHDAHGKHDGHEKHRAALSAEPEAREVEDLNLPHVQVVTQKGEELDFYDGLVKDRVVAISFIFTTCRTICPPIGANFGKLQDELGAKAGREVQLISVSVDPVTDTPERLEAWAATFGAGPGWTLVTGTKPEIDKLLKALNVFTPDYEDHTPTLLLGNDATGEWTRTYGLTPPDKLATMLEELARGKDAAEVAEEVGE